MKIINHDKTNIIYTDGFVVLDKLKPAVYDIYFDKMTGYSLKERDGFSYGGRVYGEKIKKVDKIVTTYEKMDRNLGIILSGEKGMGKSLFARCLCNKMIERGYPVILADSPTPGFVKFVNSIEQETVIFFDEFEKAFEQKDSERDSEEYQEELLPLFDGTSSGKKMFIVTTNGVHKLSDFLLNRPGRFHYHLRFANLSHDEVKEYLESELLPEYSDQINRILNFTDTISLNYDCLRAIVFEVNLGEDIKEVIDDLNIMNYENNLQLIPMVHFKDGAVKELSDISINNKGAYRDDDEHHRSYMYLNGNGYWLYYNEKNMTVNQLSRRMTLETKDITIRENNSDENKEVSPASLNIAYMDFARIEGVFGTYKSRLACAYM